MKFYELFFIHIIFLSFFCSTHVNSLKYSSNVASKAVANHVQFIENEKHTSLYSKAKKAALRGGLHGSVASCLQVVSLMWIRTIINYQYRYGLSYKDTIYELYHSGGIRRFYRGLPYAIIQGPLLKFGVVAAHEGSKAIAKQWKREMNYTISTYHTLIVACLSVLWRVFLMPMETCKTVLQVQGVVGFNALMSEVVQGKLWLLYQGSLATVGISFLAYYPWFFVHDWLDRVVVEVDEPKYLVIRSALICFVATVVSDCCSNFLRVLKTIKQTSGSEAVLTHHRSIYLGALRAGEGFFDLCGRGLATRIVANGVQTVLFTVVWKLLQIRAKRIDKEKRTTIELKT